MESTCSMVGCHNSNNGLIPQHFYPFPRNFDLCMLWVQNCGRAELFEDFAYGGAQPFINKVICSDHFNSSDFIDPNCLNKGIKQDAVPTLNCDEQELVTVKQEFEELDETLEDDAFEPNISEFLECGGKIDNLIKQESGETKDTKLYSCGSSVEHVIHDDLEQERLFVEPYMPLFVAPKEMHFEEKVGDVEYQKSQKAFRTAWKRALESAEQREARNRANALRNAFRRATETKEQRRARNQANALRNASRRANESEDERKDRLYKNAVRAALRRSMESEEEQQERRRKNALRAAFRRSVESEEQKTERRLKDKIRSAERRQRETDLQLKIRRYNDAVRAAFRRSNETEEQKQQRRMYDVIRAARRRSNENLEQRMKRLQADRERAAKRRMIKKVALGITNMQSTFFASDLNPYLNQDHVSNSSSVKSENSFDHSTRNGFEDNVSKDDLNNHLERTYKECDRLGNINVGDFSEHSSNSVNNRYNILNTHTEISSLDNFKGNMNIMNFSSISMHSANVEENSDVTPNQHPVGAVTTSPEIVWCT